MRSYIIEVLTCFHDVGSPFSFIHLHPALAQKLSMREKTETPVMFRFDQTHLL